ncbi:MAG: type II secretion system protein [Planctomycetota bacterium]
MKTTVNNDIDKTKRRTGRVETMGNERSGFSVMEVFIVIVVLCMVAAVAVPRFSSAAAQNRASDLVSKLQLVRSQIQLYRSSFTRSSTQTFCPVRKLKAGTSKKRTS